MLNKVIISGRLTQNVELRHTPNDVPVATFSIANEDDFKKNAEGKREVDFFDVVAWRGLAEIVSRHCSKGRLIEVEGRLKVRCWKDKDGNNRRSVEIHAEKVYFVGEVGKRTDYDSAPEEGAADYNTEFEELSGDDSELPF